MAIVVVEIVHDGLLQFVDVLKTPRRMRFRVISAKKRSTMLSHEPEVGEKRRWKRACRLSQRFTAGVLWVSIIIDDQTRSKLGSARCRRGRESG